MKAKPTLTIPTSSALFKLGRDIRASRIRRRITCTTMAERAYTTRKTISKIEKGDPSVSMGLYANVLYVLGQESNLTKLAALEKDEWGLAFIEEFLPKRVRYKKM